MPWVFRKVGAVAWEHFTTGAGKIIVEAGDTMEELEHIINKACLPLIPAPGKRGLFLTNTRTHEIYNEDYDPSIKAIKAITMDPVFSLDEIHLAQDLIDGKV